MGPGRCERWTPPAPRGDGATRLVDHSADPVSCPCVVLVFHPNPRRLVESGNIFRRRRKMAYKFAILDPRPIPAAIEANDKVFASGPVYGVEVTVPALAKRCTFNLDPQHTGGDANRAAIEDALTTELPSEGSTLATVRADLDAIGTMAIFNLRAKGESLESAMDRINMVATADKFARGGYSGPK